MPITFSSFYAEQEEQELKEEALAVTRTGRN